GAVVGVQPFGGEGLSGTGPKAGGPLYLYRLLSVRPAGLPPGIDGASPLTAITLPGPTGEQNTYRLQPRGSVLCVAATEIGAGAQYAAVQACGNRAMFLDTPAAQAWRAGAGAGTNVTLVTDDMVDEAVFQGVLFEGDGDDLRAWNERIAARNGPILIVQGLTPDALASGAAYTLEQLVAERSSSVNTAAAGGNASLMSIG
ncbi:MAG TPA: trifunctional transcriptional regulator/proline dehydrogenase/L-glutamate gamma-semialdehyde dehydrogenase, partial [Burkholderiaceae bacterium]|nr:trifunctional transcriptional regulator/proline dehydrogenase/L-glutamate gamma-semialdehyde dehydrogenase [Burkholderiaceae bacterium]